MSFYDIYLFSIKNKDENFDIAKYQIDNTFKIKTEAFMNKKEEEIIKAQFKAKS